MVRDMHSWTLGTDRDVPRVRRLSHTASTTRHDPRAEISGARYGQYPWVPTTVCSIPSSTCATLLLLIATYDIVICDQVLEHVKNPVKAATTLHDLLKPGGRVLVGCPFMVRIHPCPGDYWRFTEDGMRLLLWEGAAGLQVESTNSWGNRGARARGEPGQAVGVLLAVAVSAERLEPSGLRVGNCAPARELDTTGVTRLLVTRYGSSRRPSRCEPQFRCAKFVVAMAAAPSSERFSAVTAERPARP